MKPYIYLTDANIENITHLRHHRVGVRKIKDISLVYRLADLYLIGWHNNHTFYCDENEIDENNNVLDSSIALALLARGIKHSKSVGFKFNYNSLPMKKITTLWEKIEKLLKSKKSENVKMGVSSAAILTSESWRFFPIKEACGKHAYTLDLSESVWSYVDVSEAVKSIKYTLRELINDWSKLSRSKPIYIGGKKIPFNESDVEKILRTKKLIKPRSTNPSC